MEDVTGSTYLTVVRGSRNCEQQEGVHFIRGPWKIRQGIWVRRFAGQRSRVCRNSDLKLCMAEGLHEYDGDGTKQATLGCRILREACTLHRKGRYKDPADQFAELGTEQKFVASRNFEIPINLGH